MSMRIGFSFNVSIFSTRFFFFLLLIFKLGTRLKRGTVEERNPSYLRGSASSSLGGCVDAPADEHGTENEGAHQHRHPRTERPQLVKTGKSAVS